MTFFPPVIVAYLMCYGAWPHEQLLNEYAACVNEYHDCVATGRDAWACIEDYERKLACERHLN